MTEINGHVNGRDGEDEKLPKSILALLHSYGDPIDMSSPVVARQSSDASSIIPKGEIAAVVKVLVDAGRPIEEIERAISRMVAQSSDASSDKSDGRLTKDGVDALARKRARDAKYQRERRLKVKNGDGASDDKTNGDYVSSSLLSEENTKKEVKTGDTRARGRTLPDDWQPNSKHFEQAEALGFQRAFVLDQAEDMRTWAMANRNRAVARKADWDLTFTGWMKRNKGGVHVRSGSGLPGANRQGDGKSNGIQRALDSLLDRFTGEPDAGQQAHEASPRLLPNGRRQ